MSEFVVQPMTADAFCAYRPRLIAGYAEEQMGAGVWPAAEAAEKASAEIESLLPAGVTTPDHLFFSALTPEGSVGSAWLALVHPRGTPDSGWLYDIEIDLSQRGRGLGRRLLDEVETAASAHGKTSLGLAVLRTNGVALALYESAGYETVTYWMQKTLTA